jgi:hypothetical protein
MIKFSQEDLIRYLYKETSQQKTAAIKAALETDWNLQESYQTLLSSHRNLNNISLSPRQEVINNILAYAAKKQDQVHSL